MIFCWVKCKQNIIIGAMNKPTLYWITVGTITTYHIVDFFKSSGWFCPYFTQQ